MNVENADKFEDTILYYQVISRISNLVLTVSLFHFLF